MRQKSREERQKKSSHLHLWASSLSSESPHLSASSGVGLQMKAERFFNKPISARFLIVWPIRRTLLGRWEEMQMQTLPLSLTASFHSVSSLSHSVLPYEWSQQREPWVCSTVVVGGGFYSCIQCNLEGSGGGSGFSQPMRMRSLV